MLLGPAPSADSPQASVTGPGWTDELARIFDPREEGCGARVRGGEVESARPRLEL